jgi:hypothetical protein
MDDPVPGDLADEAEGGEQVVVRLEREADNEIDHRNKRVVPAQVDGMEHVGNGMPAVELFKDGIAAGLGTEMEFCVGTMVRDEGK